MKSALIIIDMQTSLLKDETWDGPRVLDRVLKLEARARDADAPIFYILDSRVEPDGTLVSDLSPRSHDRQITKSACDAFLDTSLKDELDAVSAERLAICGLHTDFCVDTTCRRAASLGYQVVLVADAHSTFERDYMPASGVILHHNTILPNLGAGAGSISVANEADVTF